MSKKYVDPNVLPVTSPPTKTYTQQEFADGYLAWCKQTGWMIVAQTVQPQPMTIGNSVGIFVSSQLSVVPFVE